jgi:hypothetical protein
MNLVVAVNQYNDRAGSSTPRFLQTPVSTNRGLGFNSSDNPDALGVGTQRFFVPNTRFGHENNEYPRPRNLRAVAGNSVVTLTWQAPNIIDDDEDRPTLIGYEIFKNDLSYTYQAIIEGLSFIDNQVVNGIMYSYYVVAVYENPKGKSEPTSTENATPTGAVLTPPIILDHEVEKRDVTLGFYRGLFGLTESFEARTLRTDWQNIDFDEDGYKWELKLNDAACGFQSVISRSVSTEGVGLASENWLITNSFAVGANTHLSFYVGAGNDSLYNEIYEVRISTTGASIESFTRLVLRDTLSTDEWRRKSIFLGEFSNQSSVRIAFVHKTNREGISDLPASYLKLDGFQILRPSMNRNNRTASRGERNLQNFIVFRDGVELGTARPTDISYIDYDLEPGLYEYWMIGDYTDGWSALSNVRTVLVEKPVSTEEETITPFITALHGNFPNPFNPETVIAFSLSNMENVEINVYNVRGQLVRTLVNEEFAVGRHNVIWNGTDMNGRNVSSGVYFYRMKAGDFSATQKMLLMK